jgi:hypothetical protein
MDRKKMLVTVLRASNLRYLNKRTMYTTDSRLTGFLGVKAVEVSNGSGGLNEILYFVNSAGAWKLAWVDYTTASLLQASDPGGGTPVTVGQGNIAPFNTAYGFSTQRLAGNVASGATFTHTADALIGYTVTTLPSSGSINLSFRRANATNFWWEQFTQVGTINLFERVSGADTSRGAAASVVSNGHRGVVVLDDTSIQIYSNGISRITHAGANFKTAVAGSITSLGTGGALSDLVSWPRLVTGAALEALNMLNP